MQLALDHVVQTVPDLTPARAALEGIGLRTVAGGRHVQWGTHNVLCHVGLPYIELLAVEDTAVAQTTAFGRGVLAEQARGAGIWRLALRTDDIERTASAVRDAGFRCTGPVPGHRARPDGSTLRWSLAFPEMSGGADLVPPMLIDWHEPDRARLTGLIARGVADTSPRALIAGVAVACRDPKAVADWMHRALGCAARETTTQKYGTALRIALRGGDIFLCGGPLAPQVVLQALETRGERPFAVHLQAGREGMGGEVAIGGAHYTFEPI